MEHPFHLIHQSLVFHEPFARDERDRAETPRLPQAALGIEIVLQQDLLEIARKVRFDLPEGETLQRPFRHVDDLCFPLRELVLVRGG